MLAIKLSHHYKHMGTLAIKDARVELKTTRDTKNLLTKAALLDGMDLSAQGQLELVRVLQQQPQPTQAMQTLRQQPRLNVRAG